MANKYIVIFKDGASQESIDKTIQGLIASGGTITQMYDMPSLKGFAGTIPPSFMPSLQSLQGDIIDNIEPDGVVTTQ